MTNTCIVFDCMGGDGDSGELVHFFRVPRDLELQKKWAQAIPKVKEPLTNEHLVCDKHFLESDMIRYYIVKDDSGIVVKKVPYEYPRLTDTAVPSIFPGFQIRRKGENPEPQQRTMGPDVVLYNNPLTDVYTPVSAYPIWENVSYDIAHAIHVHGQNTRPESVDHTSNNNPTNNEISTVISGNERNTTHDSTDPAVKVATTSGGQQNVANEISEHSAPISSDISKNINSPPHVSTDGTTDSAAQITASSGDYQIVGNGISEQAGIIDSTVTGNTLFPQDDTATGTMNLVGSVSKPDSGWENVIVDEPVSAFDQTSTPFVSTGAEDNDCCGNDHGDCYCDDCDCDECTIM